ncbi:acetylcholinesterase isoform X2 [Bradysia coprophila]|uniref:acetylcholinesterase isoform X2 n=1 Tax=Bradysia coprophila TaxID=38358 RepID=UPI00187DACFB|nr:acetylcholinesterase isoform X2 [Bradysia coprophila]
MISASNSTKYKISRRITMRHSNAIENYVILTLMFLTLLLVIEVSGQDATIYLGQGTVVGLKVFPEASRTPVYAYLGIPYAQPPVGKLRFALPRPHSGWNRTLYARNYQSICPQLDNNIYEEMSNGFNYQARTSEDCLYLNIWTPETVRRNGNTPVLCIITGEEMAFDWTQNRPNGLDLASEGIVVVTVQSRTNVFGWLSLETKDAPGNIGLYDQNLALKWIQENIQKFGGDPKQVTLLGHGTSGAANAAIHLVSPKAANYFSKLVLMSGTIFSSYSFQTRPRNVESPSTVIVRNLACDAPSPSFILECLRQKSVSDLLRAFEIVYENGNYTKLLGPEIDYYLDSSMQYIPEDPRIVISQKLYPDIPIIMGICNNEGAFIHGQWIEMARKNFETLKTFIFGTTIPNIMEHYGFTGKGREQILEAINWRFFHQIPQTSPNLLNALQRLLSEVKYETPFYEMIETFVQEPTSENLVFDVTNNTTMVNLQQKNSKLTTNDSSLFVYIFQQSNAMDLRGNVNYFGGAGHSSDLLFLMGPSLFQQIGRRKMSQSENRICRKMRQHFTDFVKTGSPTPGRLLDAWHTYTKNRKYIHVIGDSNDGSINTVNFEKNQAQIENLLSLDDTAIVTNDLSYSNPYLIGSEPSNRRENSRAPKYITNVQDSEYYLSLNRITAFWKEYLGKLYASHNNPAPRDLDGSFERDAIYFGETIDSKFKHAFFSMLVIVCLLLALLGVCVYIIKKNDQKIDTGFL